MVTPTEPLFGSSMNLDRALRDVYSGVRGDDAARIELGEGTLYDLLADSRRRSVIEYLADQGTMTCRGLAIQIAADETHMRTDQVPDRRIAPVEQDLRDEQLPRLHDAGVVEWNEAENEVRSRSTIEPIARLLAEVSRRTDRVLDLEASFTVGNAPTSLRTNYDQTEGSRRHP